MTKPLTLIVDDEPDIRELLNITLSRMGVEAHCAATIAEAKQLLERYAFDLCLTDMKLPDGDGLALVELMQMNYGQVPVIVITAFGSMDIAVRAMKLGAFDFLSKPVDLPALRQLVQNALQLSGPVQKAKDRRMRDILLGDSSVMRDIRSKIQKLARSQAPVYISGESGSGKELVARLIHQQSPKSECAFVAVNCGSIPHELMESEFFGHKKGSFTGAVSDKKGLFQVADGGTLFLDEIADLPLSLQVKLLRAIQEKKVRPVGGQNEETVNVRILSATHKDLRKMVQSGDFRQDLYYRLNVIELHLPPLRERASDIPQLAEFLLAKLAKNNQISAPKLTDSAIRTLQHYSFPGNVRELENILERALALYDGDTIDVDDLNLPIGAETVSDESFDSSVQSLEEYLETIEKKMLTQALEQNRWNKTAAAKQLGLTFRSFRYRLKKLGLD
ncbi:sigma-54-dependent transcriptional regulator [methane-oxidizing endosymbiont of Gigantopelta aegis]|uniref:sigma-54-dependent transcriptional regulator n=1 Tax=methane-oxidizing endosymbiont of Gigantopelta aegis TaxID=2794938 RepID=UPI0018DC78BD|nr:sigma-54 dependent transcriptional regulator [methane-oxidizing endosymbiont of Gigantopelta aegis]